MYASAALATALVHAARLSTEGQTTKHNLVMASAAASPSAAQRTRHRRAAANGGAHVIDASSIGSCIIGNHAARLGGTASAPVPRNRRCGRRRANNAARRRLLGRRRPLIGKTILPTRDQHLCQIFCVVITIARTAGRRHCERPRATASRLCACWHAAKCAGVKPPRHGRATMGGGGGGKPEKDRLSPSMVECALGHS